MNKLIYSMVVFIVCISAVSNAAVITKQIKTGQTVEQTVLVRPHFGTLIKFPDKIFSAILAEKSLFSCQQLRLKIVCIAQGDEGTRSSLNVVTPSNDYILTLVSKNDASYDGIVFRVISGVQDPSIASRFKDPLTRAFLKSFKVKKLKISNTEQPVHFIISEVVYLGDQIYTLFTVENTTASPLRLVDMELLLTTRAFLTGLPVKTVKIHGTFFEANKLELSPQGNTQGVLVVRHLDLSDTQELAIKLIAEGTSRHEVMVDNIKF